MDRGCGWPHVPAGMQNGLIAMPMLVFVGTETFMFIRAIRAIVLLIGCGLVVAPAVAQAPSAATPLAQSATPQVAPLQPGGSDARYSFNRVADGYLRLDAQTGQVSLCSRHQVGWACELVPDDRAVLDNEITRLHIETGKLKKALLDRGLPLPSGVNAPPASAKRSGPAESAEPSSLSRLTDVVTTGWKRLVDWIATMRATSSD